MKNEFYGFYEPSTEEVDKLWKEGFFVFDANALLNLYRYSESTRNDFLLTLDELGNKLFMPYQVGLEFHSNRNSVIEGVNNLYNSFSEALKEQFDKVFKNQLNTVSRHPSINVDDIRSIGDEFISNVNLELAKQKKNHPDFKSTDEVLDKLTKLFDNKISKKPSKEELKKIYIEGKERYEQAIPPGYKDMDTKKNKGEQHIYGDLIIWKEIISFSNLEKTPIILITDDRKEDWWTIENGRRIRAREELIKEFFDLTGRRILIYSADSFLHFAKERKLVSKIKETSISEVKEIRQADENYIKMNDYLAFSGTVNANNILDPRSLYDISELTGNYKNLYTTFSPAIVDLITNSDNLRVSNVTDFYRDNSDIIKNSIYLSQLLNGNNILREGINENNLENNKKVLVTKSAIHIPDASIVENIEPKLHNEIVKQENQAKENTSSQKKKNTIKKPRTL